MLDVIKACFTTLFDCTEWQQKLQQIIPLYDDALDAATIVQHRAINNAILHLDD
jgi:hypothetical protein